MDHEEHAGGAHAHHGGDGGPARLAASATLHCLIGCVIGEVIGLMVGVSLGWGPWTIAGFATLLAYISGFALTLIPMVLRAGYSVLDAFRLIWLGEAISIGVMEIAMNLTDYLMGGMTSGSVWTATFWFSVAVAIPAGYAAGYPVNFFMIRRGLKERCH